LLGYGSRKIEDVVAAMKEVCSIKANDGIVFNADAITAEPIREDAEYDGIRVRLPAALDKARTQLQIDIGFGDAVDPAVEELEVPVILPPDAPKLNAYPPEVVIAEKFQAMVQLGIANSRMKDFFDIWFLSQEQSFQMSRLSRALRATFQRRKTELPIQSPTALTDAFLSDPGKSALWNDFRNRMNMLSLGELSDLGNDITTFLMPASQQARASKVEEAVWPPKGPWNRPGNS
jgi:Nucleotidyl transferase AbiEii toxin, Type IV TA system